MEDWKLTGKWGDEGSDNAFWNLETGAPTVSHFGNALQVWAICQNRPRVTIAEAALAFNVPPARIYEAVYEHYWMLIEGPGDDPTNDTIEHDGE